MRNCPTAEQARVQAIMDTLTRARTIRDMADRLTGVLEESPAPGKQPPVLRDYGAELRRIVSERT